MNVIIHYPKDSESLEQLKKEISKIHCEKVINYINGQNLPQPQKLKLVESLISAK